MSKGLRKHISGSVQIQLDHEQSNTMDGFSSHWNQDMMAFLEGGEGYQVKASKEKLATGGRSFL